MAEEAEEAEDAEEAMIGELSPGCVWLEDRVARRARAGPFASCHDYLSKGVWWRLLPEMRSDDQDSPPQDEVGNSYMAYMVVRLSAVC